MSVETKQPEAETTMSQPSSEFLKVPERAVDWRQAPAARDDVPGCPWAGCKRMLREAGLRPTRQRLLLGWMLFAKGDRHVTAEMLYDEAVNAKLPVSLATVYNTLHQFTEAGLLREIGVAGPKAFFDTNPSAHQHFLIEGDEALLDIPSTSEVVLDRSPEVPAGYEVARIDVVVRLRRVGAAD
jgi:Fur family iron response transcriptional regulator